MQVVVVDLFLCDVRGVLLSSSSTLMIAVDA